MSATDTMRRVTGRSSHRLIQTWNVVRSRWILRGCELGRFTRIAEGGVIVDPAGSISIGDHTRLFGRFAPVSLRAEPGGRLSIGERCEVNFGTSIHVAESVTVGDGARIGPYCIISDAEAGALGAPGAAAPRPIEIGDAVWLATRVSVRPGVTIGAGTVVASGSVVEEDLPENVVAGGIPARVLRTIDDNVVLDAGGDR